MLPFLQRNTPPPADLEVDPSGTDNQDNPNAGHEAAASEIIDAIHSKDAPRLAEALKDMFSMLENEPEETPEPHSYNAQKED